MSSFSKPLRVGIVDDSPLIREMLTAIISEADGMVVVGTAEDPYAARGMIKAAKPDVITLDVEMPRMDGLEFLEKLMRLHPMPVIMVSTLTTKSADVTLHALELGAVDYVAKPTNGDVRAALTTQLLPKLQALQERAGQFNFSHRPTPTKLVKRAAASAYDMIGIASSTGGIERLRFLFSNLMPPTPPILVVQHINAGYVGRMVERLQDLVKPPIKVLLAENNQALLPNTITIANNQQHLGVEMHGGRLVTTCFDAPPRNGFIASADYLFMSMADLNRTQRIGIILSGMGNDGAEGLLTLKEQGGVTIGESEESCLIYGMPRAAAKLGALTHTHNLNSILLVLNS
jgi:two-component system chemotaxis response regulator CheB